VFKFNKNIYEAKIVKKDIDSILTNNMVLISGDFWGIQNFIFKGVTTKYAGKVLRAKSAFIQIFTEYIVYYICDYFNIKDDRYILSIGAGKFEILIPKDDIDIVPIQNSIDEYFKKNFYGINGLILSKISCDKSDFTQNYIKFRERIAKIVERDKFKKFNLLENDNLLNYPKNINNQNLCKICNINKKEKEEDDCCPICQDFVDLGKKLTKREVQSYNANFIKGFSKKIALKKRIKSYVPRKKDKYEPIEFSDLSKSGKGVDALGILKADVDSMGNFLKDKNNLDIISKVENFDYFSQGLDSFFSEYIVDILRAKDGKYRNIYTVFTGGDDLFLIGEWGEILDFARFIRDKFVKYVNNSLTISFGIAIAKPTIPINYLADYTEKLLEEAKGVDNRYITKLKKIKWLKSIKQLTLTDYNYQWIEFCKKSDKDAISLFGETVKWKEYKRVYNLLNEQFKDFEIINTSNLYTLLNICDMSKNIDKDIRNSLWKSKLNYLFSRNIDTKYHYILKDLNREIEKSPEATKMFLSEFIYKRRD